MPSVQSVDRAIDILQCFIGTTRGLKVAEIEATTGIARPTLYRLIKTLVTRRMLRRSEDPTRFELDYGVIELASAAFRGFNLGVRAEPALRDLVQAADETVALSVYRDGKRLYLREIPAPHALTFARGVGSEDPITRGATGIAILAFETPDAIERYVQSVPDTDRRALRDAIDRTRKSGYAISRNEIVPGASAIAAPIFDRKRVVIGSVGVYGPSARLTAKAIAAVANHVLTCARQISALESCAPVQR